MPDSEEKEDDLDETDIESEDMELIVLKPLPAVARTNLSIVFTLL